jgi:hypothetical protein
MPFKEAKRKRGGVEDLNQGVKRSPVSVARVVARSIASERIERAVAEGKRY